jgi:hypothetical protein
VYSLAVQRTLGLLLAVGAVVVAYAFVRGLLWLWPRLAALVPEI